VNRVEWGGAAYMAARVAVLPAAEAEEELLPEDEIATSHVLVLDTGGSSVAIEGTLAELAELGDAIAASARYFEQA
jgi:hypothetical protein